MSELDDLHGAMARGGEAEGLAFWRALADAELFLLLEAEPRGEVLAPRVFDLAEGPVLLAFDSEDRLAAFAETPLPYAALPGRVIAQQMAGQGLSLGLNLGSGGASEVILPPEALDWLVAMLDQAPAEERRERVVSFLPPQVPQAVLSALIPALAVLSGTARAHLARAVYEGGRQGHLLAVTGARPEDEPRLARAVTEALAFSGLDAGALDLAFLAEGDPALARMAEAALMLEASPSAAEPAAPARSGPGLDPDRPPILR